MVTETSAIVDAAHTAVTSEEALEQTTAAAGNLTIKETTPSDQENIASLKLPHTAQDGPIKTVLDFPLDTSKPTARPALTEEQQTQYATFLKTVSEWTSLPDSLEKNATATPLTDEERMFLTKECLLRYLRADKWNLQQAETRLKSTISWRRGYGVYNKLTADYISIEMETGKQLCLGWDKEGRPCHYLRPSKQNTERTDRQIEALVYMLERSIDLMPPGQETLTLLINFQDTKAGQGATLAQGRQTMYILQNHYPERLGRSLVTNVPWFISGFFKLITPFIDPLTRDKIRFNEEMGLHVPTEQLLKEAGGEIDFEYVHASYWTSLNKACEIRRRDYRARWEKAGKKIGESEFYLSGGDGKPVAAEQIIDNAATKGSSDNAA